MWKSSEKAPIGEFLCWLFFIWGACTAITFILEPYSALYAAESKITIGYIIYAIVGLFFSTPSPMLATYIVLRRHKKIKSIKDFCKLIIDTPSTKKAVIVTIAFCISALCAAIIYGTSTGSPWYMLIVALPLMILGGGVEEIGWRGFLQPELEKTFPFPIAILLVAIVWYIWHLPLWLIPTSNHYGDSLIGFAITVFVWAFGAASIYKVTKSVFACVFYHTFINSIGAIFDWNSLFDLFPNKTGMYVYYGLIFVVSIALWIYIDRKEKLQKREV